MEEMSFSEMILKEADEIEAEVRKKMAREELARMGIKIDDSEE